MMLLLLAASSIEVDEVRTGFAERIETMIGEGRLNEFFVLYRRTLDDPEDRQRLVPVGEGGQWVGVVRFFHELMATDPRLRQALPLYRSRYDQDALWLYRQWEATGDSTHLMSLVERHPFSSVGDEAALTLANIRTDEGQVDDAINYLDRLLRWYPDAGVAPEMIAARLGHACHIAGNLPALEALRALVRDRSITGRVRIGDRSESIGAYLEELAAALRRDQEPIDPAVGALREADLGNEVLLQRIPFRSEEEQLRWNIEGAPTNAQVLQARTMDAYGREINVSWPAAVPAYAAYDGREVVVAERVRVPRAGDNGQEVAVQRIVAADPATGRIYWTYDPPVVAEPSSTTQNPNMMFFNDNVGTANSPVPGVTIDGTHAFALLPTLTRRLDPNAMRYDVRDAIPDWSRVICFQVFDPVRRQVVRRILWDTDAMFSRIAPTSARWTVSHPPVVAGDRVFLPVSTLEGSIESYVVCLDRATGELVWKTFLGAKAAYSDAFRSNPVRQTYTTLAYSGGVVYAMTNVGAVAALSPVDGTVLWMTSYEGRARQGAPAGRVATPPVVMGGRVYALPEDHHSLVAFDARTGERVNLANNETRANWNQITRIAGVSERYIILGGAQTSVYFDTLAGSTRAEGAFGTLMGWGVDDRYSAAVLNGFLYMPTSRGTTSTLSVYNLATLSQVAGGRDWAADRPAGHVIPAGDQLVAVDEDICVYVSFRGLARVYAPSIEGDSPDLERLYEYAEILRRNGGMLRAAEAYERFMALAEGTAGFETRVQSARQGLYDTWFRAAMASRDAATRLDALVHARRYVGPDEAAAFHIAWEIARIHIDADRRAEAVEELQIALGHGANELVETHEDVQEPLWQYAMRLIDGWAEADPTLLEQVEQAAAEALEAMPDRDPTGLLDLMRRYPNSRTLREELGRELQEMFAADRIAEALPIWRELEEFDPRSIGPDLRRRFIQWLEQTGDTERMRRELQRLRDLFGSEPAEPPQEGQDPPQGRTIAEWVDERLAALDAAPVPPDGDVRLTRLGEIAALREARLNVRNIPTLPVVPTALAPGGIVPAEFPRDTVLVRQGSTIEMRLLSGEAVWSLARPTPFVPLEFAAGPEGSVQIGGRRVDRINGHEVNAGSLMRVLATLEEGGEVRVDFTTGAAATATAQAAPPNSRPTVAGSAFSGPDILVVAWEDVVAGIRWRTGEIAWRSVIPHDGVGFAQVAVGAGRIYVLELGFDGGARPHPMGVISVEPDPYVQMYDPATLQMLRQQGQIPPAPVTELPEGRVMALMEATGEPRWVRQIPLTAAAFESAPLADGVVVRSVPPDPTGQTTTGRQPAAAFQTELRVIALAGASGAKQFEWNGSVARGAYAFDFARGVFYDLKPNRNLRARSMGIGAAPADWQAEVETGLAATFGYRMALWRDRVVVIGATGEGLVFQHGENGFAVVKSLRFPQRRYVQDDPLWPDIVATPDGALLVYNWDRMRPDASAGGRLSLYRIDGPDEEPVGDTLVPTVRRGAGRIDASIPGYVLLFAAQAWRVDQQQQEGNYAWVLRRTAADIRNAEPQVNNVNVVAEEGGRLNAAAHRGMLFVQRGGNGRLEVWGVTTP